jgi:hypothetical protein
MTPNKYTRTHKASGWTRTPTRDMSMCYIITPTDGSGDRKVRFMSAHSWANDANDDKARQDQDRVVLVEGAPLPAWATEWLDAANRKACAGARAAFQSACDDADWHSSAQDGW